MYKNQSQIILDIKLGEVHERYTESYVNENKGVISGIYSVFKHLKALYSVSSKNIGRSGSNHWAGYAIKIIQ